ncbi:hypothetical protein D6C76_09956 [Aureobasidium pullulans]|nr:hypothetical protein D6C76_09956 [Aureobasidium pullulans]
MPQPLSVFKGVTMLCFDCNFRQHNPSLELLVEKMPVIDLDIDPDDFGFLGSGAWHGFGG